MQEFLDRNAKANKAQWPPQSSACRVALPRLLAPTTPATFDASTTPILGRISGTKILSLVKSTGALRPINYVDSVFM
ncbi:hypothetical protein C7S18_21190 [Ahniella affigens]|uniref:Uncharacterized protein n=2 Tax=Ahniella affigens TaxID=2021234 RepID=A0A2P1PXF4_9GAMM|nr:hypothetical protein C7S18_21190 [Ahniella affigens]